MNAAFCMSCGSPLSPGSTACAACGVPLPPGAQAAGSTVPGYTQAMPEMAMGVAAAPPSARPVDRSAPAPTLAMDAFSDQAPTPPMGAPQAHAPVQAAAPTPPRAPAQGRAAAGKAQAMTMMAGTALGVSEAFNAGFSRPFPGWRAELTEPIGPSTGGGRQALQPISLESQAGERLAIGRVDPVRRSVALRSYGAVSNLHSQRYSRALPINAADYDRFITQISTFFRAMQFSLTEERYVASPSSPAPDGDSGSGSTTRLLWLILVLMVAVAFVLLIYIQLRG